MSRLLDEAVALEEAHKKKQKVLKHGRRVEFADPEPWPRPVDGVVVADAVSKAVTHYVATSAAVADTVALWVVHTHMVGAFDISPRLAVVSVTKGCGKTLLFRVLAALVHRPKTTGSVSPASLFRAVERYQPTFLIDEAGKFLQPNSEFHGLITQGYGKGFTVMRTLGDSHELVEFSVYSAVALAKIGRFPSDIEDRSITVVLQRKLRSEVTHSFSYGRHPEVDKLKRMLTRWCADNLDAVAVADPDMGELFNRVADVWRPLYQVAHVLGGEWPKRMRDAAAALVPKDDDAEEELIQLLTDVGSIFAAEGEDRLPSAVLTNALVELEGRGWAEYGKSEKPLTQNRLASLLRPLRIIPETVRAGARTARGYYLHQFTDAFTRYLGSEPTQRHKPTAAGVSTAFQTVTPESDVTVQNRRKPSRPTGCVGVSARKAGNGTFATVCECCGGPETADNLIRPHLVSGGQHWLHAGCKDGWLIQRTY
jgi:putative DNA primase/helicase